MRRRSWKRAAPTALLILLAACGATGIETDWEQNQRKWQTLRPVAYAYSIERLCFCGAAVRGPVRVEVSGATVTSRTYVLGGSPVPSEYAELFPSVDGLFDILREADEAGAFDIQVTYDPLLGVPIDFWIDYSEHVADEELGMRVTEAVEGMPG
jgi:hypothetical protein